MEISLDSSVLIALANDKDVHNAACVVHFKKPRNTYSASLIAYLEALRSTFRDSFEVAIEAGLELESRVDKLLELTLPIARIELRIIGETGMGMPDSVICATAEIYGSQLWTCDKGMVTKFPQAKYIGA